MLTERELDALRVIREYWHDEKADVGDATAILSAAVVRIHPAGDEEPFAPQWLEAVCPQNTFGPYACTVASEPDILHFGLYMSSKLRKIDIPPGSTIGDVRRFLAWQGVELRKSGSGG